MHDTLTIQARQLMLLFAQVWSVTRGKGKHMPSGGTLIVGREQDCVGGCFDSAPGASSELFGTPG